MHDLSRFFERACPELAEGWKAKLLPAMTADTVSPSPRPRQSADDRSAPPTSLCGSMAQFQARIRTKLFAELSATDQLLKFLGIPGPLHWNLRRCHLQLADLVM